LFIADIWPMDTKTVTAMSAMTATNAPTRRLVMESFISPRLAATARRAAW
jgi:hypothetical protein